ncbi:hypothetical protein B0H16DRAFT_1527685 [Mycena metata]|uniref:Uncharacterized protein n=1 Tax=Mycena metata TaxID=1033252 RepID=A0AAD7JIR8_9AGAR|nr:hypothetical protein B0H16DRAFT_1527685 [Mycena metata]
MLPVVDRVVVQSFAAMHAPSIRCPLAMITGCSAFWLHLCATQDTLVDGCRLLGVVSAATPAVRFAFIFVVVSLPSQRPEKVLRWSALNSARPADWAGSYGSLTGLILSDGRLTICPAGRRAYRLLDVIRLRLLPRVLIPFLMPQLFLFRLFIFSVSL